jgi:hypothetical protein
MDEMKVMFVEWQITEDKALVAYFKTLSRHLTEITKTQVSVAFAGVLSEIQESYFPNNNYGYIGLLVPFKKSVSPKFPCDL